MTYAPSRLLEVRAYLKPITGLSDYELGIVGDEDHDGGYHHGWDQRRIIDGVLRDYSWLESTRDSSHKTNAASAFDLGMFARLRELSVWLAEQCAANKRDPNVAKDCADIRSIIYSPDGLVVKRWDRISSRTTGDSSHRGHTHISYFRDAEDRDKTAVFRRFFQGHATTEPERTPMLLIKTAVADEVYASDGHTYRHMTSGAALVAAQKAGHKLIEVGSMADLEALAGKPASDEKPVTLSPEQLDQLAVKFAALAPKPPTAAEVAKAVNDEAHARSAQ